MTGGGGLLNTVGRSKLTPNIGRWKERKKKPTHGSRETV